MIALALPVHGQDYADPLSPAERDYVTSNGPIRVVLGPTGAPYAFAENGIQRGLAIDILRLISVELGVEFQTRLVDDFGEGYAALERGDAHIYGPAAPDSFRKNAAYTEPFAQVGFGFWVGSPMAFATSPSDLDGHRVAVPNVSTILRALEDGHPDVTPVIVPDPRTGAIMVANGQVDGLYAEYSNIGYLLREDEDLALRPLGSPAFLTEATWAVRSDAAMLHSILNKGLAAIGDDQLNALHLKWTGLSMAPVAPQDNTVLLWVLGATVTGTGLLVLHSMLLRRQVQSHTRQLRAERDKFARIMETNPGPVLVLGPDQRVLYANGRAEQMLRLFSPSPGTWAPPEWEIDDLEGHPIADHETPVARVAQTRKAIHGQRLLLRWADGYVLPVSCNAAPLLSAGGEVIAVVLALDDLQDHLAAQQAHQKDVERRAEMRRLRETDAFRAEFMNAAAHEIKTPLTPLALQLHLIEKDPTGLSPGQERSLEVLRRNLERLSRIACDMLDITRIESGQVSIRCQPADVSALATEVARGLDDMAREHGIRLRVDAKDAVEAEVDAPWFMQVLEHLLSNAIKFTPLGGEVLLRVAAEDHQVRVEVIDTGIGLTKDQQDRLFLPFARLHTDRHEAPGPGLGLHVSKRIVEAHGGSIACHSPGAGKGSTFTVCLPCKELATMTVAA